MDTQWKWQSKQIKARDWWKRCHTLSFQLQCESSQCLFSPHHFVDEELQYTGLENGTVSGRRLLFNFYDEAVGCLPRCVYCQNTVVALQLLDKQFRVTSHGYGVQKQPQLHALHNSGLIGRDVWHIAPSLQSVFTVLAIFHLKKNLRNC